MKLDSKGITLVEIIISVALISIVLIFLFSLLIQVNNENSDNEVRASYLVNQSTFIKQIQEDFLDYTLESGSTCEIEDIVSTETVDKLYLPRLNGSPVFSTTETEGNIKCLKFKYEKKINTNGTGNYAYLFIYKKNDNQTILSYYRGDFKQSVILEDFDWETNSCELCDAKTNTVGNHQTYHLPIIGSDYKDYSINLFKPEENVILELVSPSEEDTYTLDVDIEDEYKLTLKNSTSLYEQYYKTSVTFDKMNSSNSDYSEKVLSSYDKLYSHITNTNFPTVTIKQNNTVIENINFKDLTLNYYETTSNAPYSTFATYEYNGNSINSNYFYLYLEDNSGPIIIKKTEDGFTEKLQNNATITLYKGSEDEFFGNYIIFDNYYGILPINDFKDQIQYQIQNLINNICGDTCIEESVTISIQDYNGNYTEYNLILNVVEKPRFLNLPNENGAKSIYIETILNAYHKNANLTESELIDYFKDKHTNISLNPYIKVITDINYTNGKPDIVFPLSPYIDTMYPDGTSCADTDSRICRTDKIGNIGLEVCDTISNTNCEYTSIALYREYCTCQ